MNYRIGHRQYENCTKYAMQSYGTQVVVTFHDNTKKTFTNKAGWLVSSDGKQLTFTRKKAKKAE